MSTDKLIMGEINKEIGLRIAAARKNKGMSAVELSQKTGFASARISHWEQGRRLPNLESVLVLEQCLEVPAAYLLCVDRDIYTNPNHKQQHSIPLYDMTTALMGQPLSTLTLSIPHHIDSGKLFAIHLMDDSMSPLFRNKDIVTFNPDKSLVNGSLVLFKINKTNQILFRQYWIDNTDIDKPLHTFLALSANLEKIKTPHEDSFTVLGIYSDTLRVFL
jgi:DNA-binding XRE family transcriptional regulator